MKKYKHNKSGKIVKFNNSGDYFLNWGGEVYPIPSFIVENSNDWSLAIECPRYLKRVANIGMGGIGIMDDRGYFNGKIFDTTKDPINNTIYETWGEFFINYSQNYKESTKEEYDAQFIPEYVECISSTNIHWNRGTIYKVHPNGEIEDDRGYHGNLVTIQNRKENSGYKFKPSTKAAYNKQNAKVELTMDEIASKFGIDVKQLKIKK